MKNKPEIRSCREIACICLLRVEGLDIKFSNGEERIYERPGEFDTGHRSVMVVPLVDHRHFMMIREYAADTEDYQLTLPKGLLATSTSPDPQIKPFGRTSLGYDL